MAIKVKYNSKTTLVEGYFPSFITYLNNIIDVEARTIDSSPYIEITEEQHQAAFGKKMCVVDGIFQEYVAPDSALLEQGKISKIEQCKAYLVSTDKNFIEAQDTGVSDYPEKANRRNAREVIAALKSCKTLEELNNINVNFN